MTPHQPPYGGQPVPVPQQGAYGSPPYGPPNSWQPAPALGGGPPNPPLPPNRRKGGVVLGIIGGSVSVVLVIVILIVLITMRSESGFPDAKFALTLPEALVDGRFQLAQDLSDSEGQRIEDEAGAEYVKITDSVVGKYDLGGDESRGVLLLSGMYGRFKDTVVPRENMLKGAGEGEGVTVAIGPRVFTQSGSPTVSCEVLKQDKSGTTLIYPVCAWADENTAAAVAPITSKTASQDPSGPDLRFYAKLTLQVRSEAVKPIG
ncbi:hypothetical protein [Actinomadura physcomitrii]|uniref:hypothetical protein n=1 Tax=Actinomadura physcomitrii TaxID=2650748 RepID=UPI001924B73F|nr:hypothetical protein [Actinomadura physcomitrii]